MPGGSAISRTCTPGSGTHDRRHRRERAPRAVRADRQGAGGGHHCEDDGRGEGLQAVLDGKAKGYRNLVQSAGDPQVAAALLLIERLTEIANIQAKAIQDLPIDKIIIWDGGSENGGMSNLGKKLMGALPPMHELAKQVGLELPEFLGKLAGAAAAPETPRAPKSNGK